MNEIKIIPASDSSLLIKYFAKEKLFIYKLSKLLEQELGDYILDLAYTTSNLIIHYDIIKISFKNLSKKIQQLELKDLKNKNLQLTPPKIHKINVYYDLYEEWDLAELCLAKKINIKDFIKIHSSKIYEVEALGFLPGFGYLGSLDEKIRFPRRLSPRIKIKAGSIAIANRYTTIYPSDSPGGWNIIGHTSLKMIDWNQASPTILTVGDSVKFEPTLKKEF